MKTDFAKNGYYYNFFGDLMCFIHQVFTAPEENASGIFYHGTAGFYHKYPKPYTSAILLAIDHELVRRPYIPKLSEEQYKAFLKDYYIFLKDVLGVKVEHLYIYLISDGCINEKIPEFLHQQRSLEVRS